MGSTGASVEALSAAWRAAAASVRPCRYSLSLQHHIPRLIATARRMRQAAPAGLAEAPAALVALLDELSQLHQGGDPDAATEFLRALSGLLEQPGSDQVSTPQSAAPARHCLPH